MQTERLLTHAHDELFRRPPEEHFASFEDIREAAAAQRRRCRELGARDPAILFRSSARSRFDAHARPGGAFDGATPRRRGLRRDYEA